MASPGIILIEIPLITKIANIVVINGNHRSRKQSDSKSSNTTK